MRRAITLLAALLTAGALAASCSSAGDAGGTSLSSFASSTGIGGTLPMLERLLATAATTLAKPGTTANEAHTVCGVLYLSVEQANSDLPAPDATVSHLLAAAYSELGAAADACDRAVGDPAQLAAFEQHRAASLGLLTEATAALEARLGTLSTATTTPPGDQSGQ
jgi:hypothetical protein